MREIPPELDSLMWRLAEEGGPTARAEFEARHVRYGPELSRRVAMVAELRQAGRTVSPRPTFTPRPIRQTPFWTMAAAIGLAVVAVGAVAFVVSSEGPKREKPLVKEELPKQTTPVVVPPSQRPLPTPEPMATTPSIRNPKPERVAPYNVARDVRISDTSLTAAIDLVAAGGGLKVTVAPGFEERRVSLDYRGLDTVATLRAMGEEYGFSVIEEEEGNVLVVPVRQTDEPTRSIGL